MNSAIPTRPTTLDTIVERLSNEGLIGMRMAAAMYGTCREGKATHSSTPTRHALKGYRTEGGRTVKLEAVRIAGRLMTSRQAVLRFFAAMNEASADAPEAPAPAAPAQRKREAAKASRQAERIFGGSS